MRARGSDQVSGRGATTIVQEPVGHPSAPTGISQGVSPRAHGDAVAIKNGRTSSRAYKRTSSIPCGNPTTWSIRVGCRCPACSPTLGAALVAAGSRQVLFTGRAAQIELTSAWRSLRIEGIDATTPAGRFQMAVLGAIARGCTCGGSRA